MLFSNSSFNRYIKLFFPKQKTKGQIVKTRMKVCETHTFLSKGNTICVLMEKRNISSF